METVLIFDETRMFFERVIYEFEKENIAYLCCETRDEINKLIKASNPTMILLTADIQTVKEFASYAPEVPILVLVFSNNDTKQVIEYLDAGAVDVMSVHRSSGELIAKIQAIFRRERLNGERTRQPPAPQIFGDEK